MPQSKPASRPDAATAARFRLIPGGYSLEAWPLHLPLAPDEQAEGWLRRISHRLGFTPKALLQELSTEPLDPRGTVADWIRGCDLAPQRLGFAMPAPRDRPLERPSGRGWKWAGYPVVGRFCGSCLADDGVWRTSWQLPWASSDLASKDASHVSSFESGSDPRPRPSRA